MTWILASGELVCVGLFVSGMAVIAILVAIRAFSDQHRNNLRLTEIERQLHMLQTDRHSSPAPSEPTSVETKPESEREAEVTAQPATPPPPPPPVPVAAPVEQTVTSPTAKTPAPPVDNAPESASTKPRVSIEERLGVHVAVALGAIVLAITGVLLAVWIYRNFEIPPIARVSVASILGVVLVGGGHWMRGRSAWVASGLVAAGVACLYGCVYFAAQVYVEPKPLISLELGFVLMATVTVLGVMMSLMHGRLVAVIGMLGGFVNPYVMSTGEARAIELFSYLLLLQIGLTIVARQRGWFMLAVLTMAGAMGWVMAYIAGIAFWDIAPEDSKWVGLFLLGSVASVVFSTQGEASTERWGGVGIVRGLVWFSGVIAVLLITVLTGTVEFTATQWALMWVMCAGLIAVGRFDVAYHGLAWLALGLNVLLLIESWGLGAMTKGWSGDMLIFAQTLSAFGLLFALGGYACILKNKQPVRWAVLSVTAGLVYLLTAYILDVDVDHMLGLPWYGVTLCVAGLYLLMCAPVALKRQVMARGDQTLGVLAVGVTAFVAIALPMAVDKVWLTIAWALMVPVLIGIGQWARLPVLRKLSWGLVAVVAVRLLLNPAVWEYKISRTIVFNELLLCYGVPMVAFALAAWLARREKDNAYVKVLEVGAIVFAFALVTTQTRLFFMHTNNDYKDEYVPTLELAANYGTITLTQLGTYGVAWLGLATLLTAVSRWTGRHAVTICTTLIVLIGLGWTVIGLADLVMLRRTIGVMDLQIGQTLIFNPLLYVFGMPLLLSVAIGMISPSVGMLHKVLRGVGWVGALLCLFVLISTQIRHAFHPTNMRLLADDASLIELGTYANSWLLLALGLVVAGRLRSQRSLQVAGWCIACVAVVLMAYLTFAANPLWYDTPVGETRIFNWLLYAYGLPAVLLLAVRRFLPMWKPGKRAPTAMFVGVSLLFVLTTLQVRQWFCGNVLVNAPVVAMEGYAYSAAWVVFGMVTLACGIILRNTVLRWMSLFVMLLAVGKVFLWDTRQLEGLYRIFSFAGLGISLMMLAFCYQRFVFRRIHDSNAKPNDELDA